MSSSSAGSRAEPLIRKFLAGAEYFTPAKILPRVSPSTNIEAALSKPSWSVKSMLPPAHASSSPIPSDSTDNKASEITREKLHHLLTLSALPLPKSEYEEKKLLSTLRAQIHFVNEIRKVDTEGVEPLAAIRDETAAHVEESTITLADLQSDFDQEEVVGRNGRIRKKVRQDQHGRTLVDEETRRAEDWDPFAMAEVGGLTRWGFGKVVRGEVEGRRAGRYFVVKKAAKTVGGED